MKDYTIAQLCNLYKTDIDEFRNLEGMYEYQSRTFEDSMISKNYEVLTHKLVQREITSFMEKDMFQLRELGYRAFYDYGIKPEDENDSELNIYCCNGKNVYEGMFGYGYLDSTFSSSGDKRRICVSDESNLQNNYVFLTGELNPDWSPYFKISFAKSIRSFYISDFYLNDFKPKVEALKLSWLIPVQEKPRQKNNNKI